MMMSAVACEWYGDRRCVVKLVGYSCRWPFMRTCWRLKPHPPRLWPWPHSSHLHLPTATYKAGNTVELAVMITTNHYGRFKFRVCPPGATKDSQCTGMQRW